MACDCYHGFFTDLIIKGDLDENAFSGYIQVFTYGEKYYNVRTDQLVKIKNCLNRGVELSLEARMCVWKSERYDLTEDKEEAIVTVRSVSGAPYLYFPGYVVTGIEVNGEPLFLTKPSDCGNAFCSGPIFMYFPYIKIYSEPNGEVRIHLRRIAGAEPPSAYDISPYLLVALVVVVVAVAIVAWWIVKKRSKLPPPPLPPTSLLSEKSKMF